MTLASRPLIGRRSPLPRQLLSSLRTSCAYSERCHAFDFFFLLPRDTMKILLRPTPLCFWTVHSFSASSPEPCSPSCTLEGHERERERERESGRERERESERAREREREILSMNEWPDFRPCCVEMWLEDTSGTVLRGLALTSVGTESRALSLSLSLSLSPRSLSLPSLPPLSLSLSLPLVLCVWVISLRLCIYQCGCGYKTHTRMDST